MSAWGLDTAAEPWLCQRCGYLMDAVSPADASDAVPVQGDLCLCLNCGAPHTLDGEAWRLMTAAELEQLAPEERRALAVAERALAEAALPDLTADDGRA